MNMSDLDLSEIESLLTGYWLTDLANFSSQIYTDISDVNWAGFYLSDGKKLRLGPFCGKPACTEIAFERGVCGRAFSTDKPVIVDDVDAFPGHIRCDADSKSEIVIPFQVSAKLHGVFDVDSSRLARFTEADRFQLEKAIQLLASKISSNPDQNLL